ncbi:hypothetical protein DFH08DRAFT_990676 [Mycena albidolilacea]|uniref:Uncharacterized protein n=1 Tax=Mycena albidolilacea TaxID=1033008 RepID=A0AAD7A8T1_9AGAR|nr:hypothetical protein DFH08DRAFT_990676 [Mycena albidolilacea]
MVMEDTGGTYGPGWSTAAVDFLDELYARDAEKTAAAEKLRVRLDEQNGATGASSGGKGKGKTPYHRKSRSRKILDLDVWEEGDSGIDADGLPPEIKYTSVAGVSGSSDADGIPTRPPAARRPDKRPWLLTPSDSESRTESGSAPPPPSAHLNAFEHATTAAPWQALAGAPAHPAAPPLQGREFARFAAATSESIKDTGPVSSRLGANGRRRQILRHNVHQGGD